MWSKLDASISCLKFASYHRCNIIPCMLYVWCFDARGHPLDEFGHRWPIFQGVTLATVMYNTYANCHYSPLTTVIVRNFLILSFVCIIFIDHHILHTALIIIIHLFMQMKFGGHGYSHILLTVVPKMLQRGITKDAIDKILIDNPRTWLTFK